MGQVLQPLAVSGTAAVAVGLWFVGSGRLLCGKPAAGVMLAGVAALVVHMVVAMGLAHGWSYAAAVEHTRRTAGVGAGFWVNYLFAAVWLADATWMAMDPSGYARRPRWVGRTVTGFLGFVVFNATVVYGGRAARVGGAAGFTFLAYSRFSHSRRSAPSR
jgi:hypothetical protein